MKLLFVLKFSCGGQMPPPFGCLHTPRVPPIGAVKSGADQTRIKTDQARHKKIMVSGIWRNAITNGPPNGPDLMHTIYND